MSTKKSSKQQPKFGFIYRITNVLTKQNYIGLTLRPVKERWAGHRYSAASDVAPGSLAEAIKKYGAENFRVRTLGRYLIAKLGAAERRLIKKYGSIAPNGYNRHIGGAMSEGYGVFTIVKGRKFISLSAAAREFKVDPNIAKQRLANGWSIEEALGLKLKADLFGPRAVRIGKKKFRSIQAAAKAFGLFPGTVVNRIRIGWSDSQALGVEPPPKRDAHNGIEITVGGKTYSSIRKAARALGADSERARERLSYGWTPAEAFGLKLRKRSHHREVAVDGNIFPTMTDAAAHFGILYSTVMHRLRKHWTVEQALGIEPPPFIKKSHKAISVRGQDFKSISEAASYFKVPRSLAIKRLGMGWTSEEALNLQPRKNPHSKPVTVFGTEYAGLVEALTALKVSYPTLKKKLSKNISAGRALEEIVSSRGIEFRGKTYKSYKELARTHKVNPVTYWGRIKRGWSMPQALGIEAKERKNWNARKVKIGSKTFSSILEASRHYEIDSKVVFQRMRLGWSVARAITAPLSTQKHNCISIKINGKSFPSITAAAEYIGIDVGIVQKRIGNGWSIRRALLTPKLNRDGYRRKK